MQLFDHSNTSGFLPESLKSGQCLPLTPGTTSVTLGNHKAQHIPPVGNNNANCGSLRQILTGQMIWEVNSGNQKMAGVNTSHLPKKKGSI